MEDTHHGFYLLVPEVCHQSGAVVDKGGGVAQESVDSDLGGDPDVGEGDASPRRVPFGDVEKPLGGRAGLEEVAEETSNLEGGALWDMRRTILV